MNRGDRHTAMGTASPLPMIEDYCGADKEFELTPPKIKRSDNARGNISHSLPPSQRRKLSFSPEPTGISQEFQPVNEDALPHLLEPDIQQLPTLSFLNDKETQELIDELCASIAHSAPSPLPPPPLPPPTRVGFNYSFCPVYDPSPSPMGRLEVHSTPVLLRDYHNPGVVHELTLMVRTVFLRISDTGSVIQAMRVWVRVNKPPEHKKTRMTITGYIRVNGTRYPVKQGGIFLDLRNRELAWYPGRGEITLFCEVGPIERKTIVECKPAKTIEMNIPMMYE